MGTIGISILMACLTVGYGRGLCESEADCSSDECCVAASHVQLLYKGVCRRLGRAGSPCNEVQLNDYEGKYLSRCPCLDGAACEPTGRYREGAGNNLQIYLSQRCQRAFFAVGKSPSNTSDINSTDKTEAIVELTTDKF